MARVRARRSDGGKPAFTARAIVGTDEWDTVGFDLADIEVVPTRDEARLVGHLGPDPLSDDWDPVEAARRLGADDRAGARRVSGPAQRRGVRQRVRQRDPVRARHPSDRPRPSETDAAALVDLGARMIRANRDRADRTFTGDARPGRTTWVYGREGRPCRRCGTLIRGGSSAPTRRASATSSGARRARPMTPLSRAMSGSGADVRRHPCQPSCGMGRSPQRPDKASERPGFATPARPVTDGPRRWKHKRQGSDTRGHDRLRTTAAGSIRHPTESRRHAAERLLARRPARAPGSAARSRGT